MPDLLHAQAQASSSAGFGSGCTPAHSPWQQQSDIWEDIQPVFNPLLRKVHILFKFLRMLAPAKKHLT